MLSKGTHPEIPPLVALPPGRPAALVPSTPPCPLYGWGEGSGWSALPCRFPSPLPSLLPCAFSACGCARKSLFGFLASLCCFTCLFTSLSCFGFALLVWFGLVILLRFPVRVGVVTK
ncbi:hypothetical protein AMAG_19717 [Allomyces macrogynus ATCC 38327]|uniref:Uncharacterized protein n=1 Tax=Allomyces macrogynus (strain ATCC 38327) TaxID=578462 RepID=A0A0L0SZQ6_ALLM3|nr:hypothetical protein AMAG_19717 [Allomyces macrogynus ATCC 38327]|eukprot:KNE67844.1 hypothetical protein AMAG_19717 [Allomyces macrogynus ATCC 38327]